MRAIRIEILAATVALGAALPASAAQVTVKDAWFRALPGTLPSGGYFTLHNGGTDKVTLNGADSPACGMLMLHKSQSNGGTEMMMDMPSVDVAAGQDVKFAPGGYHLMCMDPKAAMKPGGIVSVTLDFADGTKVSAPFKVKNAQGK